MSRSKLFLSLLIVLLLLPRASITIAQDEAKPRIVASFSILADVVQLVAGEAAGVTTLVPVDADPHGFIPAPRDLVALEDADVVFTVGAGFEDDLLVGIIGPRSDFPLQAVSLCVPILPFDPASAIPPTEATASPLTELCANHNAELDGLNIEQPSAATLGLLYMLDCAAEHDHEGAEAGTCDPHVWLDPANVMRWALIIRDTLSDLDPANAALYAANADGFIMELNALIREVWQPALASIPQEQRKLVTNHGAFNYLADWGDLTIVGLVIPAASSMAEASAAETATLIDLIRAEGVPAIFAETTTNPQLAEQIAAETGATFHTLYTGSLSHTDGPAATYFDYMTYNIQTIVEALGGTFED